MMSVLQDGPGSLQLHIMPKSMEPQLQSANRAISLAGAGGMGLQVVPNSVASHAMVSYAMFQALWVFNM